MSISFRRVHLKVAGYRFGVQSLAMIAIIGSAFFKGPSFPAQAQEENLSRSGQADGSVLIREHAGWNEDCKAIAYPPLYLLSPPHHGNVCAHADEIKISSMYVGTESQCIGHLVRGVRLIYRPDPSFVGDDSMQYAAQYPSALRMISVNVTVTAQKSRVSPSAIFAPKKTTVRQASGPVPVCAEFAF